MIFCILRHISFYLIHGGPIGDNTALIEACVSAERTTIDWLMTKGYDLICYVTI